MIPKSVFLCEYRASYTLDDDSESYFYDGFESLAEAADAVSPKRLLATIGKHRPALLYEIERERGLMLQGFWISFDELGQENEP